MQEIDNNQNEIILFPPSSLFINVGLKEITSAYANFLLFEIHQHRRMKSYQAISLRSKRFQSSYCAKVRAEAKKSLKGEGEGRRGNLHSPPPPTSFIFFLLLSQFSRWTSRGNACYASYQAMPLVVICTSKSKELMTTIKKTRVQREKWRLFYDTCPKCCVKVSVRSYLTFADDISSTLYLCNIHLNYLCQRKRT